MEGGINPASLLSQLQGMLAHSTERSADVLAQQAQAAAQQAAFTAAVEHLACAIEALAQALARPPG